MIENFSSSDVFPAEIMKLKFRESYYNSMKKLFGENAKIDFETIRNLAEIWKIKKDILNTNNMTNLNSKTNEKKKLF